MTLLVLFTDFGPQGPYVGQMQARLAEAAPGIAQVELMRDAPAFNPRASAYLLAAYAAAFPPDSVFLCVVDPAGECCEHTIYRASADCRVGLGRFLWKA